MIYKIGRLLNKRIDNRIFYGLLIITVIVHLWIFNSKATILDGFFTRFAQQEIEISILREKMDQLKLGNNFDGINYDERSNNQ